MSKQFLEIDSFSQEDIDAMFNALCLKACGDIFPDKVKLDLNPKIKVKDIKQHKTTLNDLLGLIKMFDIPFKFTVSFVATDGEHKKDNRVIIREDENLRICDVHKNMVAQKEEITNPDLQNIVIPVIENKTVERKIDVNSIPDFL